jgi:hypothetical protein
MLDTSKYMNKKTFADSLGLPRTTFERRCVQIDFILPGGLLSEDIRQEWIEKLRAWERLQVKNKRDKGSGSK